MEDDSLITKLTVTTHQTHEPLEDGAAKSHVDLIINVVISKAVSYMGNIDFSR